MRSACSILLLLLVTIGLIHSTLLSSASPSWLHIRGGLPFVSMILTARRAVKHYHSKRSCVLALFIQCHPATEADWWLPLPLPLPACVPCWGGGGSSLARQFSARLGEMRAIHAPWAGCTLVLPTCP